MADGLHPLPDAERIASLTRQLEDSDKGWEAAEGDLAMENCLRQQADATVATLTQQLTAQFAATREAEDETQRLADCFQRAHERADRAEADLATLRASMEQLAQEIRDVDEDALFNSPCATAEHWADRLAALAARPPQEPTK